MKYRCGKKDEDDIVIHLYYHCINAHQFTFDYPNLEADILKTKNDMHKIISDYPYKHFIANRS